MPIHPLFPEPVYFSPLERTLTKAELKLINKYKKEASKNKGNDMSSNKYVLEHKIFKNLKKDLYEKIMEYFNKIVCSDTSATPYFTQSWLNYTGPHDFHHRHTHPNSYVSGVFYINADRNVDYLNFYKKEPVIDLNFTQRNVFNSTVWRYPVNTGDVVLFPSYLEHGVEQVDKEDDAVTRISLSFNVFLQGTLGAASRLTEAVLK